MQVRIVDPGHVGLRRGVRTAVGTTVALATALVLLPATPGPVLAAFGSMALLGMADFGGSWRRRTKSLIATGIAGAVLIAMGGLAALNIITIVVVTFLVTGTLAFLVALRGSFANAAPALTTVYVASAMITTSIDAIPPLLAGWGIAVAVALPVTLLILPRRNLAPVRSACIAALQTLASLIADRVAGKPFDRDRAAVSLDQLQASYLGNPFRAAGLRAPDRALLVLVGQVEALLTAAGRGGGYLHPISRLTTTRELADESARCLGTTAHALESRTAPPSAQRVVDLWQGQWNSAVTALGDSALGSPAERVDLVDTAFPDRAMAIAVVRLNILVRRVLGVAEEAFDQSEHTIPDPPIAHPWRDLASQVSLRSPWMRLALRTGVGLALAALVVELIGLSHGFWVLLGVVATLRMDGVSTLKTSMLALTGTFAGALVGYGLLEAEGTHPALMWIGFVVIIFLAVYTQATTAYIIGQAAFSLFVIVAFSLASWPPDLGVAVERFEDIAYGAAISVVVALLMWPRGVLEGLRSNVAEAITRANAVLMGAVTDLVDGGHRVTSRELIESSAAFSRSEEVVEVSLSSKNVVAVGRAKAWQVVVDNLRTLTVGGHLVAGWSSDRPSVESLVPALGPPLIEDAYTTTRAWERTAAMVDGADPGPLPAQAGFIDVARSVAGDVDLSNGAIADRVVGSVWTHGWIQMAFNAAVSSQVPQLRE